VQNKKSAHQERGLPDLSRIDGELADLILEVTIQFRFLHMNLQNKKGYRSGLVGHRSDR
jgi:hypothetical protein